MITYCSESSLYWYLDVGSLVLADEEQDETLNVCLSDTVKRIRIIKEAMVLIKDLQAISLPKTKILIKRPDTGDSKIWVSQVI